MRTVLLVLQSDSFRYALSEVLKDRYHVTIAQNAALGAELLREQPDILILDLFLPCTDGFRFLEKNRHLLPPAVLLFTTYADQQILLTAEDLGIDAVFLKPCSISAVLKELEQI